MVAHSLWQTSEPGIQDVKVFQREGEQQITGRVTCRPGSVVASISLPREDRDDIVRVGGVNLVGSRRVKVEHEGRVAALNLGRKTSEEFAGSTLSGDWTLSSLLLPGEVCGDPEHNPPETLQLSIITQCRETPP